MSNNELLDAALLYASLGWRVFPLVPRGKNPAIKGWQDKATTDAAQIVAWWERNPSYNVGIKTGDGLCVIDVDDKPDKHPVLGSDMLREWELDHGDISETVCCQTPTGGMHYYFDIGSTRIDGCQSDTIFIDLRCDGNLIVAPPSIHPETGTAYVWDISPEDMAPTRANATDRACIQWVWDNRKNAGEGGKFTAPPIVHEGEGRDETLYKMACSMWAKNMPEASILAALRTYNDMCCVPPLPDRIVEQKVRSATSKKPGLSDEVKKQVEKKASGSETVAKHVKAARDLLVKGRACYIDGAPAVYDGTCYRIGFDAIERMVLETSPNAKNNERMEVIKYLRLVMRNEPQAPARYIAFENGVLDIETMELLVQTPDLKIPNVIPHRWDPDAKSELLETTIAKIACGDADIEKNLYEFIGLCMYRSGSYAYAAFLLGNTDKNANNGKSTYIQLLANVLGKGNYSVLSLQDLGENFKTQFIAGKLANLGDDIPNVEIGGKSMEVFKKAVSGNEINADVKGIKGFDFTPYCTMVFSCNELPRMRVMDDGVARRMFPIRFAAEFKKTDPDHDPNIKRKLADEAVIEAAIAKGVEGLRRVVRNTAPTENAESREMLKSIRIDNSYVLQWLDDTGTTRDDIIDNGVGMEYSEFCRWCNDSGVRDSERPIKREFSKAVCKTFGFRVKNTSRMGNSVRIFAERDR